MSVVGSVAAVNAAARAAAKAAGVAASTAPALTIALSDVMSLTTVPAPAKLADLPPLPRYFRKKSRAHPHFKLRKVYRWQDFAPYVDNIKIVYDPANDGTRGCKELWRQVNGDAIRARFSKYTVDVEEVSDGRPASVTVKWLLDGSGVASAAASAGAGGGGGKGGGKGGGGKAPAPAAPSGGGGGGKGAAAAMASIPSETAVVAEGMSFLDIMDALAPTQNALAWAEEDKEMM